MLRRVEFVDRGHGAGFHAGEAGGHDELTELGGGAERERARDAVGRRRWQLELGSDDRHRCGELDSRGLTPHGCREASVRLEKGVEPRQHPSDVGEELQALAAQHGVEGAFIENQLLSVTFDELDIVEPLGSRALGAIGQHLARDVGADDEPVGRHRARGTQAGLPVAGGDV